ncbi:MAG: hypothetical protein MUF51_08360 [Vicinamibacteria bacterium]|nr:hypothetical protein [Vicinamibacteria bacterium]
MARGPLSIIGLLLLIALVFAPGVSADEVWLKNGGKLTGQIVERNERLVKIDVGSGIIGVTADRIERVVASASPVQIFRRRAQALRRDDVAGWLELGRWAEEQQLQTLAREAYEHVVGLAPDDAEARAALGQVREGSRWMTQDEVQQSRGLVKFEGEWITPEQHRAILAERLATVQAQREERMAKDARAIAEANAAEAEARRREAEANQMNGGISWPYGIGLAPGVPSTGPCGPYLNGPGCDSLRPTPTPRARAKMTQPAPTPVPKPSPTPRPTATPARGPFAAFPAS